MHPLLHHEIDGEVLHGGIEQLLDDARQPVDLVDEKDVLLRQVAQEADEIAAALDRRAGRRHEVRPHLVGDDAGQRGLAEAGRTIEEHMIDALPALLGRLHRHAEAADGLMLADVLVEAARTQRALEGRVVRRRRTAQNPAVLGRHAHVLFAAAWLR